MTLQKECNLVIDGSGFPDLEVTDAREPLARGHWDFLTKVVPGNPWIAGLAAIVGIVWLGTNPWVQAFAIIGVTLITVLSIWQWSLDGRSKATTESSDVRKDTIPDRKSQGEVGQRLSFGSDPPVG
jgi:hypothetical protein